MHFKFARAKRIVVGTIVLVVSMMYGPQAHAASVFYDIAFGPLNFQNLFVDVTVGFDDTNITGVGQEFIPMESIDFTIGTYVRDCAGELLRLAIQDDRHGQPTQLISPVELAVDQFVFDLRSIAESHLKRIAFSACLDALPARGMDSPLARFSPCIDRAKIPA